ncbi:hypothetical protein [Candidatus Poriferisocius sp.]|uniref:hypothetical protein n=1 Tax=Candidatus Poriferisocius sp. TaxID=3101276 RepID=UPI003B52AAEB
MDGEPVPVGGRVSTGEGLVGQLIATRTVLWDAVRMLSDEQADELQTSKTELAGRLRELWADGPTDHQQAMVDEYEMIALRLRHRFDFVEDSPGDGGEFRVMCLRCETLPVLGSVCPTCETGKWLHVVSS